MLERMPYRRVATPAVIYVGMIGIDRILVRILHAGTLVSLVPIHLVAGLFGAAGFYLIGDRAVGESASFQFSKAARVMTVVGGLAVILTITILSRDWWLAVEMLVLFALLLIGAMMMQSRKRGDAHVE
jgi:hypothetical protein